MRSAVCRPWVCQIVQFTKNDRSVRSASQKFPEAGATRQFQADSSQWSAFSPAQQSLRSIYTGPQTLPLLVTSLELVFRDAVQLRLRFRLHLRYVLQSASYDLLRPSIGTSQSFGLISHRFLHTETLCSGLTNCTNLSHKICTATCCIPNCSAYDSLNVLLQL